MRSAWRVLVAVPALAVLAAAGAFAVQRGIADDLTFDASLEMRTWITSGAKPGEETWNWVRADLERAAGLVHDATSQELLGVLLAMRPERPELTALAGEHFRKALVSRPTSGYTWANLAEIMYRQGQTGAEFEVALRRAVEFGPNEPEVQRKVADLGLAVFDEVGAGTRAAIEQVLGAGIRRKPMEMLQISYRRGRLDIACRYAVVDKSGAPPEWLKLCPGAEATQTDTSPTRP